MSEPAAQLYEFGHFRLDLAEQRLTRGGAVVPLTPKAFETLVALIEQAGHVVKKEQLMGQVWPGTFVEEGNLSVTIFMLRKALAEEAGGQKYIETVPKRGYRFVAPVRRGSRKAFAPRGGGDQSPPDTTANRGASEQASRGARPLSAALPSTPLPHAAQPASVRRARAKAIDSLAVLPLMNGSDDPNTEYLSDGITESIINSLAQLPQLRVLARSTVFRYKGREVDPMEVGREMSVRAVLTGRVMQIGNQLIIRTELVDVADGWQLWGEQYNRQPADILAVQEEISREISAKLRLKLSGDQKRRLTKRHTENSEAYQTYLKGRFHWNKRTLEGIRQGIEYFQQAIALDPRYALADAGLADSYALLGAVEYGALPPDEAMRQARAHALRALEIDDTLAEAHASLAYIKIFDWDWSGAEQEYRRAIELNPNYATARHWYAHYLTAMNRQTEAAAEIKRARELDPLSLPISAGLGWHYFLTRRFEQAIGEYRKTLEMDQSFYLAHFLLGLAYEQVGRYAEALMAYRSAHALSNGGPAAIAGGGRIYALTNQPELARQVLGELDQLAKSRYVSPYYVAAIHAGLDDKEQAFDWLRRACDNRSEGVIWLALDPTLDSLRSDPRFAELLQRVGLR